MVPEPLLARLRAARRLLLTSHVNPDGDAIGSALGLARVLAALGKEATVWNAHPTPSLYAELPGAERIHVGATPPEGFPHRFDLGVVLECPTLERTGLESPLSRLPLLNIDHHLGNAGYGDERWIDTSEPALGVMIADLADALGAPLDADTAACLYVALATDTGGFRFANATPRAFEAAGRLVAAGAGIERVSRWLYESQSESSVRLLAELIPTLERHDQGRVAVVHLTAEMIIRSGARPGDTEGLVDTPRSIDGVEAVALLRETARDEWKVSLRSRGAVDVERIARAEGGGGHKNAAGCRFRGTLDAGRRRFAEQLSRALAEAHGR